MYYFTNTKIPVCLLRVILNRPKFTLAYYKKNNYCSLDQNISCTRLIPLNISLMNKRDLSHVLRNNFKCYCIYRVQELRKWNLHCKAISCRHFPDHSKQRAVLSRRFPLDLGPIKVNVINGILASKQSDWCHPWLRRNVPVSSIRQHELPLCLHHFLTSTSFPLSLG